LFSPTSQVIKKIYLHLIYSILIINLYCFCFNKLSFNEKCYFGVFLDLDPKLLLAIRILQIISDPTHCYQAYNAGLDPSVANVFAASAFRFGHTLIQPLLRRLDPALNSIPEGDLPLHRAFFAPWRLVEEGGLDPLLRGLFASPGKMPAANEVMNSELTERLFQVAHTVALDLAALNIQRGRDHGIPPYTHWLRYCGLGNVTTWDDLRQHIQVVCLYDCKLRGFNFKNF